MTNALAIKHRSRSTAKNKKAGFTLIELSIVLVIIGLIVGGVLVGQDLIRAAEVRAQISQIEKYNTAVNTFRGKFNAIPGDMSVTTASQFGFSTSTSSPAATGCDGSGVGKRDGNGLIDGAATAAACSATPCAPTTSAGAGNATVGGMANYEAGLFWQDLSSSTGGNLVDGSFSSATCAAMSAALTSTTVGNYMPSAKLGRGLYVAVFNYNGYNWYDVSGISAVTTAGSVSTVATPMSVVQSYNIDKKMDDGYPTSGNVQALYVTGTTVSYAASATTDSSSTCYNSTTSSGAYSLTVNNGGSGVCALSFRFQ